MVAWPGGTGTHPFNLEINGNDVIDRVDLTSVDIQMPGPGSNGSMRFTLWDSDASQSPVEWDEVRFIEWSVTRELTFGGFVQAVETVSWAANGRYLRVECMGYGVLLDRKVVPSATDPDQAGAGISIGDAILSITNRHGGRVHAFGYEPSHTVYQGDATKTVFASAAWLNGVNFPTITEQTLRSAIEQWAAVGTDSTSGVAGYPDPSVAPVIWVDAAARLHAFWDNPLYATGYQDDAGTTGATGTLQVTDVGYERDGSDQSTSVYVKGGNANGTGFVRAAAKERAGDLESFYDDSTSTSTSFRDFIGASRLEGALSTPIRGTLTVKDSTYIDLRPGMKLTLNHAQSAPAGTVVRITGVSVAFLSGTGLRRYTLTYGGLLGSQSAMRRLGRLQFIRAR